MHLRHVRQSSQPGTPSGRRLLRFSGARFLASALGPSLPSSAVRDARSACGPSQSTRPSTYAVTRSSAALFVAVVVLWTLSTSLSPLGGASPPCGTIASTSESSLASTPRLQAIHWRSARFSTSMRSTLVRPALSFCISQMGEDGSSTESRRRAICACPTGLSRHQRFTAHARPCCENAPLGQTLQPSRHTRKASPLGFAHSSKVDVLI